MRIPKHLLLFILLLGCSSRIFPQLVGVTDPLKCELDSHFSANFSIPQNDVNVEIIHTPNSIPNNYFIKSNKDRLGHQTIWLVDSESHRKFPVTVFVTIEYPILIATRQIPMKSAFNEYNTQLVKCQISRNLDEYVKNISDLNDMMAVQVIRDNTGITWSMIRPKPHIEYGDDVKVKIVAGDLSVETKGISKRNGRIGEEAKVLIPNTGKTLYGKIISENTVKIELN